MARPTKYKREMCQIAQDTISQGFSKEATAGKLGIAKDTLYEWEKKHKEFSDAIKLGEAASQLFWEGMGINGAVGNIDKFNSTSWIFNMKNRFNWKDKQELSGDSDNPLAITINVTGV